MLAFFQHLDPIVNLRPLGLVRRGRHCQLCSGGVASLRYFVRRRYLFDIHGMLEARGAQPISRFAERVFSSASRAVHSITSANLAELVCSGKTTCAALAIELPLLPSGKAFASHAGVNRS